MKHQLQVFRIAYSVPPHSNAPRPWPHFDFYVEASTELQALNKFSAYTDSRDIRYQSLTVGLALSRDELPAEIRQEKLDVGLAILRAPTAPRQSSAVL